jgi:Domain of unknown function (DUF4203)
VQFVIAIVALLVGAAFCFGGFRFFLLLLPIWGFVVGFNVGTEAVRALFNDGTFATVLSWVVGLVLAVGFSIFSYLYYWLAIALLGGGVGYAIGASAWGLIGNEYGLVAFVIGVVCGAILALVVLALNVPKYLVIVVSGLGGAATVLAGWFVLIGTIPTDDITWTAIGAAITDNGFYLIVWGVLAAAGIVGQVMSSSMGPDSYELNRASYRYG